MAITRDGDVTLLSTDSSVLSGCVDSINGFLYLITFYSSSTSILSSLIKINISNMTVVGRKTSSDFYYSICQDTNYLYLLHWVVGGAAGLYCTKISKSNFTEINSAKISTGLWMPSPKPVITQSGRIIALCSVPILFKYLQWGAIVEIDTSTLLSTVKAIDVNPFGNNILVNDGYNDYVYSLATLNTPNIYSLVKVLVSEGKVIGRSNTINDSCGYLDVDTLSRTFWFSSPAAYKLYSCNLDDISNIEYHNINNDYNPVSYIHVNSAVKSLYCISDKNPVSVSRVLETNTNDVVEYLNLPSGDNGCAFSIADSSISTIFIVDRSSSPKVIKISVTPPSAILYPPSNISTKCGSFGASNISFISNSISEDGHEIERSTDLSNWSVIAVLQYPNNSYNDSWIDNRKNYYYRVRAYKGLDYSDYSSISQLYCDWIPFTPARPSGCRAIVAPNGRDTILTWNYDIYDSCGNVVNDIIGFKIFRKGSLDSIYTEVLHNTSPASFARNSNAYIEGSSVAANTPRYINNDIGSKSIFIEDGTTNLLTANQASVETDLTGFSALGGATILKDTGVSYHGSASCKVVTAPTGNSGLIINSIPVTGGNTYTASVRIYHETGGISIKIEIYDGSTWTNSTFMLSSGWNTIYHTKTVDASATYAQINIFVSNTETTFWYDCGQLEQKPYPTSWQNPADGARVQDRLSIPRVGLINDKGEWTIYGWFKLNSEKMQSVSSPDESRVTLFELGDYYILGQASITVYKEQTELNKIFIRVYDDRVSKSTPQEHTFISSDYNIPIFFVLRYDGAKMYFDSFSSVSGHQATSLNITWSSPMADKISIGCYGWADGCLNGYIRDFAVYNVKLSDDEIYDIYSAGVMNITDNTTGAWTFNNLLDNVLKPLGPDDRRFVDWNTNTDKYKYKILAYNNVRSSSLSKEFTSTTLPDTNFFNGKYKFDGKINFSGR